MGWRSQKSQLAVCLTAFLCAVMPLFGIAVREADAKTDPETVLYDQLCSGDAQQRQKAVDELRQIVTTRPNELVRDMQRWLKPLMEAGLYEDVKM